VRLTYKSYSHKFFFHRHSTLLGLKAYFHYSCAALRFAAIVRDSL